MGKFLLNNDPWITTIIHLTDYKTDIDIRKQKNDEQGEKTEYVLHLSTNAAIFISEEQLKLLNQKSGQALKGEEKD